MPAQVGVGVPSAVTVDCVRPCRVEVLVVSDGPLVSGSHDGSLPGLSGDIGVHPFVRAAVGLLLGVALGVLAGLLVPRRRDR